MFDVSDDFLAILRSRSRDLACVYELYQWKYEPFPAPSDGNLSYDPRYAIALWSDQSLLFTWGDDTIEYTRVVTSGPGIQKHISKQFDSIALTCSNIKANEAGFRYLASFVLNNRIQGMRLVARVIPRSANSLSFIESSHSPFVHSFISFVGRCDKPDGFNRSVGKISAKQDLGTIESQIPERDFQPSCPLAFKKPGGDCLGNQLLSEKTPPYQAAKICNKTEEQCIEYGNEKYFQGTKVVQIESSFVHKSHRTLFQKIGLGLLTPLLFRRKKTTVGNSIHDGTPYGSPVSVVLGRWQKSLLPIQFQDIGTSINFKMAACRGLIKDFVNLKQEAPNFTQILGLTKHLGDYGGVGTQTADTVFPGSEFHSKLAYITGFCNGSEIETEDPAPDITGLIAGQVVRQAYGTQGNVAPGNGKVDNALASYASGVDGWSDNPVDLARFIINDPAYLAVPNVHISELESAITSAYMTGAIKDVGNAERCLLPNTETARAGVDYKRYHSTGLVGPLNFYGTGLEFLFQGQRPGGYWAREAEYEFFEPDSPPTSLGVITKYRKRYTVNIEINEKQKAIDFLYDKLLVCFRGFIRWDRHGRLAIDCERPADHSYLRANVSSGATSIKVLDVTDWLPFEGLATLPDPLRGKILIGAHKLTSEVRPVTTAQYSEDGNGIPFSASSTSGTMTAVASGASLSGGSSSTPASGSVVISGACAVGDVITITIDGYEISLTCAQEDVDAEIDNLTVASQLAFRINAEPILKEYVEARRTGSDPTSVDIYCKYGVLNFTTPLEEDHFAEIADPEDAPTASTSAGSLLEGTYLLSYAFRNSNGNTNISPILAIDVADDEQIDVDAITLPAGADSIDWFISVEVNSDVRLLVFNNDGSAFSINSLPAVTNAQEPKRNTTGEEILRVMYSDAQRALAYADTTRATHLDGSFEWPEGGKQSTVNQVKGTYREAIQDFAEQPVIINDERHQEDTGQTNTANIDLSAVDNYNQASRLLNGYLAKLRDADFFFKWSSAGEPILLEIGDVVCLSDDSGEWRNVPVRIEDISLNSKFEASFTCRLYSTSQFDDAVLQTQVPLPSGLINYLEPPPSLTFDTITFPPSGLEQTTDGSVGITSIRGGVLFADSVYPQFGKIRLIKRAGVTVDESINDRLAPNGDGEGVFEFLASADGLYTVQAQACNQWGCSTAVTASIIIGFGTLFGIATEAGALLLQESGDFILQES